MNDISIARWPVGGRGGSRFSIRINQWFKLIAVTLLFAIWVGLPLFMGVLWSLVDPDHPWSYPHLFPEKLSFYHWEHAFKYTDIVPAIGRSFFIAFCSTLLAFALALPTAYALGRMSFPGKEAIKIVILLPIMLPGMVVALFLGRTFIMLGLSQTYIGVILGHALLGLPYMLRILIISFESIPQEVVDAADNLGAGIWTKLKEIYLPLIMPGFLAGSLFTFIASIEEFNISFVIGSPSIQTITTILFSYLGYNFVRTSSSVISLILIIPNLLILFLFEKYFKSQYMSAALGKV